VYLLDTNHCSKILSGHSGISRKLKLLGEVRVATCVVVQGELVYMAEKSANPADNRETVAHFLDDIEVFLIDEKTANVYGKLKAALIARFGPREKAKLRRIDIERLGFRENDIWIAATASRHGLTIVTADSDFRRMQQAVDLDVESWWTPSVAD
jgi:tRNA(fMet)-specific endonuclease VapC